MPQPDEYGDAPRAVIPHTELIARLQRLEQVISAAGLGVWEWNVQTGETRFNDRWAGIVGYRLDELEPTTIDTWAALAHPDDLERSNAELERVFSGEREQYDIEVRVRHRDGHWVWIRDCGEVISRTADGAPEWMVGTHEDVGDRVAGQRALADSERRYRLLAEHVSDAVWQVGADGRVHWASESTATLLGWQPAQVVGQAAADFVHPDDLGDTRPQVERRRERRVRMLTAAGDYHAVAAIIRLAEDVDGIYRVITIRDVAAEALVRQQLRRVRETDALTGLPNRDTALLTLQRLLDSGFADEAGIAVLSVSVDQLTSVNEGLSYSVGDVLLTEIAERIGSVLGDNHQLARGFADKFVVIMAQAGSQEQVEATAQAILAVVRPAVRIGPHRVLPTVSIGIAMATPEARANEVLRDATTALRRARHDGRDRYRFTEAGMASVARRRLEVTTGIRDGLRSDQFHAWYQPIVALPGQQVLGYEALIRWHRDGDVEPPDRFLAIAEASGLMPELDLVMLRQAVGRLRRLPASVFVAVNVSAATLARPDYAAQVVNVLADAGVASSRLHLEVTEHTLLARSEQVTQTAERIAALGVRWYADDFGTGYSSISHLRDLPIAGVKLDRSFTARLASDQTSAQLARAIAGLAEQLGLDSVAEGITSMSEVDLLRRQGWRCGQGSLFGDPRIGDDLDPGSPFAPA